MNLILEVIILIGRILWTYVDALINCFKTKQAKSIRGKVALVTGAGRGIGRQIANSLSEHGAKLALLDIDQNAVQETAQIITDSGQVARGYKCDVTNIEEIAAVGAKIRSELGEVDVLVNNAGVMMVKPLFQLEEKEIRRTMEINCIAHFWTLREFLPSMIARKSGHVVCICSVAGRFGTRFLTDYCASKFAADGLMESLSDELRYLRVTGINLTSVYPFGADTKLLSGIADRCEYVQRFKKLLQPEDVARAVVNGVLYNERRVYVPDDAKRGEIFRVLLPRKGMQILSDFMATGFVLKKQK